MLAREIRLSSSTKMGMKVGGGACKNLAQRLIIEGGNNYMLDGLGLAVVSRDNIVGYGAGSGWTEVVDKGDEIVFYDNRAALAPISLLYFVMAAANGHDFGDVCEAAVVADVAMLFTLDMDQLEAEHYAYLQLQLGAFCVNFITTSTPQKDVTTDTTIKTGVHYPKTPKPHMEKV